MKKIFAISLSIFILTASFAQSAQRQREGRPQRQYVSAFISAVYEGPDLVVTVTYKNMSPVIVYLDKQDTGIAGVYNGNGFFLKTDFGYVEYSGNKLARKYYADDYVALRPRQEITAKVNLTESGNLELKSGTAYSLFFDGQGRTALNDKARAFKISSNVVEFTAK